jgi:ATP-dependent DNA helicase RecG
VFHNLGFVVIDEQHRFGVEQRQKLLAKSSKMPHLLAMTATPIPRSLQLTIYGELDISILNEKPKNRLPIETAIISPNSRTQMYEKVEHEIQAGHQVYVICPRIEEGVDEQKSVEAEIKRLRQGPFRHRQIGLLHGKLSATDKQAAMLEFSSGKTDILVSTTVVEVGVDVPNATVIIIEGADTFGLAQLHQLRGRVGRSELQSYCYLVPSTSQKPSRRLKELEKSNDGFYLAEKDLELRGPGEIYGRAQHGDLNLQMANIGDTKLTKRVRAAAEWLVKHPDGIASFPTLAGEIGRYRRLTTLN